MEQETIVTEETVVAAPAAEETMADYAAELEASFKQGPPNDDPAWDRFEELLKSKEIITVKVDSAVKAGVVAFVDGVRAFIPASKLANGYVEKLDEFVGKEVEAVVVTAEKAGKKLVLSVRDALKAKKAANKEASMAKYVEGAVVEGTVDSLKDYGAFIKFEDGVSGLLHVSQIAWKRVNVPADVLKEGDKVTVKVIGLKDGKISLSKKALEEAPVREKKEAKDGERKERGPRREKEEVFNYKAEGKAATNLGDLFKGIKLN